MFRFKSLDRRTTISIVGFVILVVLIGVLSRLEQSSLEQSFPEQSFSGSLLNQTTDMQLTSSQFSHQGTIPQRYTCDGEDVSPPLTWSDAPTNTQSFVLIVRDPDAPAKPEWTHWIIKNIPATVTAVAENTVPAGGVEVMNDFGRVAWGGPCPPDGEHRYFFEVYALDVVEVVSDTLADVEMAMEGHVLAKAELMATYQRSRQQSRK